MATFNNVTGSMTGTVTASTVDVINFSNRRSVVQITNTSGAGIPLYVSTTGAPNATAPGYGTVVVQPGQTALVATGAPFEPLPGVGASTGPNYPVAVTAPSTVQVAGAGTATPSYYIA